VVPSVLLGISYSTYSAILWANVALVVPEKTFGTAYGLLAVIQNVGSTVAPYIVGYINDSTTTQHGYFWSEIFFIAVSLLALASDSVIWYYDRKYKK
jgi:MFS family permease